MGNQDQNSVFVGKSPSNSSGFSWWWVLGIVLLVAIVGASTFTLVRRPDKSNQAASQLDNAKVPLDDLLTSRDVIFSRASSVQINGSLQVNNGFVITPTLQPTGAKPGQIYFDQTNNQLAYYNGSNFVFLNDQPTGVVQSLGGATGQLSVGTGLSLSNGTLSNGGVLSVQGKTGAVTFTAGAGIVINGTNFSNSGVLSIKAGTPNVTVTDDNGAVTISVSGGSGGTLSVSEGGTGATSLTANGVLVGNGTSAISSIAAGGAGLCLLSTVGAPTWGACSGGGSGVSSLNSLTGALSIANASGSGSTITIDNASTSAKGIASFNSSNFSVTSGAVNTIQNIGTGASPAFAAVNTNTITPSGAFTLGATGQAFTMQGSAASTITATSGGNTTTVSFATPTAARAVVIPNESGTICLQGATSCGFLSTSDTNIAKLNAVQTFTGNGNTFQNASNSGTAFRVLTAGGSSLLTVDTTEGEIELGQGSSVTGTLLFRNAANGFVVTLSPSVQTNHRTITLPDEDGTLCIRSSTSCGFILNTTSPQTANISITGNAVIGGNITVNGHIISGGSTPGIAAGAAACSSPTVGVSGKDTAGLITVTTGTSCGAGGKLATITFTSAFGAAPRVVLTAADTNSAGLHYYVDNSTISTTTFDLTTQTGDTINNTTTYRWYYQVIQ